jgi:hypothetical protein
VIRKLRVTNVEDPTVRHPVRDHPEASTLVPVRLHRP